MVEDGRVKGKRRYDEEQPSRLGLCRDRDGEEGKAGGRWNEADAIPTDQARQRAITRV